MHHGTEPHTMLYWTVLLLRVQESPCLILASRPAILAEVFMHISGQIISKYFKICHDCLLPNPYRFTDYNNLVISHSILTQCWYNINGNQSYKGPPVWWHHARFSVVLHWLPGMCRQCHWVLVWCPGTAQYWTLCPHEALVWSRLWPLEQEYPPSTSWVELQGCLSWSHRSALPLSQSSALGDLSG
jgi:hypothetical protein